MLLSPLLVGEKEEPTVSSSDCGCRGLIEGETSSDGSTLTELSPQLVGLKEDPIQSSSD